MRKWFKEFKDDTAQGLSLIQQPNKSLYEQNMGLQLQNQELKDTLNSVADEIKVMKQLREDKEIRSKKRKKAKSHQ